MLLVLRVLSVCAALSGKMTFRSHWLGIVKNKFTGIWVLFCLWLMLLKIPCDSYGWRESAQ